MRSAFDPQNHILQTTFYTSLLACILSSLTTSVGSLIDGVIIGRHLGVDSMAAFGLVSPIVIVFNLFGAVISSGARNRFTMLLGRGDIDRTKGVFTLSVLMGTGTSVLLMALVFVFADPICVLLGATDGAADLLDGTRGYLLGIAVGLPAMNAARVLGAYMTIDNDRRLPVLASVTLTVCDIVLDCVVAFVLSDGGMFEMGLATSVSHYAALLVLLFHFRRRDRLIRFSFRFISWKEAGRVLARGLPMGIGRISNTLRCVILNRMLAAAAAAGFIAAYSIQRQADSLLNPFTIGLAETVAMLTGILVARKTAPCSGGFCRPR